MFSASSLTRRLPRVTWYPESKVEEQAVWILALLIGLILGHFLPAYFSKKGENLATKEDIALITKEIESVKHDYSEKLEGTKALLSTEIANNSFRYEKEYDLLSDLASRLVNVRDSCLSLRPAFDMYDPDESEEDRKIARLQKFYDARRELYQVRENKKPFYSSEIYESILEVEKAAHAESLEYQHRDYLQKKNVLEYWDKAQERQQQVADSAVDALEAIRTRVQQWN